MVPAFDLHERVLARTALRELRRALVPREDVGIPVHAHRVRVGRIQRIVPGSG